MNVFKGKGYVEGKATGPVLVSGMPVNFTASFSSPINILPGRRSEIRDRHHDLFGKRIKNTVLIFPAAIGSTFTGMVLLDRMHQDVGPCAIVVRKVDSLLISGSILADVWFQKRVPIVEYDADDLFETIRTGDRAEVDGHSGEIRIL